MCQPVVEASKVWKIDADKESSGGHLVHDNPDTHRTSTGYPPAQFDHYDAITNVLPANQKSTAQEAHRATRWRETNDFQFECADERKYPITYKKMRAMPGVQSVHMHTSTHDPILEPSYPNPKLSDRSRPDKRLFVVYPT